MTKPEFTIEEKCRMFDDLYHIAEHVNWFFETSSFQKIWNYDPAKPFCEMMHILLGKENGW